MFSVVALVGSLAMCFTFLFGPVAGIMVQRFGCRVTTIVGGLCCSVGLFCSSLPNNMYILFVSYSLVHGFGSSLIFTACLVVASLYFNKRRSIATGIVTAGQGTNLNLRKIYFRLSIAFIAEKLKTRTVNEQYATVCACYFQFQFRR